MPTLARQLRITDYFTLAFGTMVGVGWLVLMDDWLGRGGPLGAALGFALGGLLLLPVGYVYGQWVQRLPDAASEAAYTAQVFPPIVSFFTGWIMLLAYFIVCPWEAVAIGKVAAYIFPSLNSFALYSIAGQPVFLPRLLLGIAMTAFLTILNYRGIRLSATFQNWTASTVILIFLLLLAISVWRGAPGNFQPLFRASPLISIVLTLQIVPYFLTGFESAPKCAEEANPEFKRAGYMRAIALALLVGAGFYALSIIAVSYVAPWQSLLGKRFATAIAFEHAFGARWPVSLILVMAFFGLFQCFNGREISDALRRHIRHRQRHHHRSASWRRAPCPRNRSRLHGLRLRLDCSLPFVLDCRAQSTDAPYHRARHPGFIFSFHHETVSNFSRSFLIGGVDRPARLVSLGFGPPQFETLELAMPASRSIV